MAVVANPYSTRLGLILYEGDDDDGKPIERRTSYQVKYGVDHEDLYEVAEALASLSVSSLVEVVLDESSSLTKME